MDKLTTLALSLLLATATTSAQSLSFFETFADHAVLQADAPHPVWGWARPGARLTLTFAGQDYRARADKQTGRWAVTLPATPAGGPHTITCRSGRETLTLEDIYFGDVYLLGGQSNMEWTFGQTDLDGTAAGRIADPMIRHVKVDRTFDVRPRDHLTLMFGWQPALEDNIANFSAVGTYFAHYLREAGVERPIGLVSSNWGGSRIEPWISAEALGVDPDFVVSSQDSLAEVATRVPRKNFAAAFPGEEVPTEDEGESLGYLDDRVDLSNWGNIEVPGHWESRGYPNIDGIFYFRRTFTLTPEQAAAPATLRLGAIDDGDWTHINGVRVGSTPNAYSTERIYEVPASVLRPGENTLAIRVYDSQGGGGFSATPELMRLETTAGKIPLAGTWKYRIGEWRATMSPNQIDVILYNAMIAPLAGLPLTGVLWYQGESNAGAGSAEKYADHMRTLIADWRGHFGNEDLPFYWVQLANWQPEPTSPDEPGWAILRASQTAALDVPNTGQAVIIDIGEADDIHPRNKWEVGRRLSLHARKNIYGEEDLQASSPVAVSAERENDRAVEIEFAGVGEGLTVVRREGDRYGYLKGFTARDSDGNWHWAQAVLDPDENEVYLTVPGVSGITKVRYAWSNNPAEANLYSKEGLPVTPFELTVED